MTSRSRALLLSQCFIGTVLIAGLLISCSPGGIVGHGYGTGGSECELTGEGTRFPLGVPIHDALTISPALKVGGTVTVTFAKDGEELADLGETYVAHEPTDCLYAILTDLEVGHYRVEYLFDPSTVPPIVGEFDVTPDR